MAVAFRRIMLSRFHSKVFTGQSVTVMAQTIEADFRDRLIDVSEIPQVSIFDPLGVQVAFEEDMTRIAHGVYAYTYHIPWDAPIGVYTGTFAAINDVSLAHIERIALWKVIQGSVMVHFSYLIIHDQTHVPWYWHFSNTGQLVATSTVPKFLGKTPVSLYSEDIYWLRILNSLNETVYVLPQVTGAPMVAFSEPEEGPGVRGSFIWKATDARFYEIAVNQVNQITSKEVIDASGTPPILDEDDLIIEEELDIFGQDVISFEAEYTTAQTNTIVVPLVLGKEIIVTQIQVSVDNSTVPDVGFRVSFGTSTSIGVILSHPGMPPGSSISRGNGSGVVARGTTNIHITLNAPTAGALRVVMSYFRHEV